MRGQMWLELLLFALSSPMSSAGVVEYNLTIGYFIARPDGRPVTVLGINEQLPSPTLEVTRGDTLVVHVHNNDPVHAHSLHWHGLAMKGAPEYDGVAGVTQCGILPFSSMTYRFVVLDEPGTYWYHGHAGLSHAGVRGIAGPLLVRPRPSDEVHEGTYTRDLLLYVMDWAHEPSAEHYANAKAGFHEAVAQSAQWHNVALYKWTSALINGLGGRYGGVYSILNVVRGETARLRICNTGENFALRISVDYHKLTVIATDGVDTEPFETDVVIVHLGERYDVLVTADQLVGDGNFYIRAQSLEGDLDAQVVKGGGDHVALGVLRYHSTNETADNAPVAESAASVGGLTLPPVIEQHIQKGNRGAYEYVSNVTGKTVTILNCFDVATPSSDGGPSTCVPVTALTTHAKWRHGFDALVESEPDEHHEVAFTYTRSRQFAHFTRVSPNLDEPTKPPKEAHRGPGPNGERYTQFVKPGKVPMYTNKTIGSHEHSLFLDVNSGSKVQIAWNHESHTAHPIHVHGYKFVVAAIHEAPLNRCSLVDCQEAADWFSWPADRAKVASTISPGRYVVKDTVNMPFGGYVVTRFVANNPGQWIAHCHTDHHLADGMGVILRDAPKGKHDTPFTMPDGFPQCAGMAFEAGDSSYIAMNTRPACECLAPIDEPVLRDEPEVGWRCSTSYNCRHVSAGQTLHQQKLRARGLVRSNWSTPFDSDDAEAGRRWVQRSITLTITVGAVLLLTAVLQKWTPKDIKGCKDQTGVRLHLVWRAILAEEVPKRLSFLNMASALGLSAVAGLIYLDAGFNDLSERKYEEKISLVFWQVAFWSVSTVYGATVSYHSPRWFLFGGKMVHAKQDDELKVNTIQWQEVSSEDVASSTVEPRGHAAVTSASEREETSRRCSPSIQAHSSPPTLLKGVGSFYRHRFKLKEVKEPSRVIATEIWKYHALRFVASFMLSSPWPILYALVVDCFTGLSPSVGSTFLVGFTLVLTSQAFEAMGRMLSEFAGASDIAVAVTFASIFSQLLVIAGGFYKTVTFPLFAWVGHVNAILYGFSAVAKTYFKSTDSFWVTPPDAIPIHGYTWSSIEFMGAFNTLRTRGVTVVDSLSPPGIGFDIAMLIVLSLAFRVICFVSALLRANGGTLRQFWSLARRLCLKQKEADVPEEEARDVPIVPIEEIEEAFNETPQPSRSRRSSKLQLDVVQKLEENHSSVSAGRMAAADKSFF